MNYPYYEIAMFLKVVCRVSAVPVKFITTFCTDIEKKIQRLKWKHRRLT